MENQDSVSEWVAGLKAGDSQSEAAMWDRFFDQVRQIARRKLGTSIPAPRDEEDLALSALNALMVGAREGRFRQLESRDDVWQLLNMILARKISNVRRGLRSRPEIPETDLVTDPNGTSGGIFDRTAACLSAEDGLDSLGLECDELLSVLDPRLQQVALLKLAGHSNEQIATSMGRSHKTVERYLKMIRLAWAQHSPVAPENPEIP